MTKPADLTKPANRRFPLRPWVMIVAILASCVVVLTILYVRPVRHHIPLNLPPSRAIGFLHIDTSPPTGTVRLAESIARTRFLDPDGSRLRRFAFDFVVTRGMPERVVVWLLPGTGSDEIGFVGVVDLPRMGRLARPIHRMVLPGALFSGGASQKRIAGHSVISAKEYEEATTAVRAYSFHRDSLLVSSSPSILANYLASLSAAAVLDTVIADSVAAAAVASRADVLAVFANETGRLTEFVRDIEDRVAFAAIPSIDTIPLITAEMTIEDTVASSILSFVYEDRSRAQEVYSDVRFLYGTLRRMAKSQELDLRGNIIEHELRYDLEFGIEGLDGLSL